MKRVVLILIAIFCLLSAGCTSPAGVTPAASTPAPDAGFVLNLSVRPGDDFYAYVNDAWLETHPIPADKKSYSTFSALGDTVDDDLHALLVNASNTTPGNTDRNITLIGQFYRSGMDNRTIDKEGLTGLSADLTMIDAINSRSDLTNATITLLAHGDSPVYSYWAENNPKNSSEMVPGLEQGGLGMPDRDYYLRTDNQSVEIQNAYRQHIARVFELSGETKAKAAADADTVYSLEKTLAASHFSTEENRDPATTTNLYTPAELEQQYPAIGWDQLASLPGSGPVSRINIHQPRYVKELNTLLETAPLEDWKVYLKYHLINSASPYLSTSFEAENFAFYSTTLNGVEEMKPRWKRVETTESDLLSDAVGKAYVAAYVDPRTREMVSAMVVSLRQTLDERITNLTWMGNSTKAAAHEKLAAMRQKIGYPDTWMDYAGLNLSDSYVKNVRSVQAYNLIYGPSGLSRIGRPVDPNVWYMSPQTINAYYNPTTNEIVFPTAILQPPFFDPNADAAHNYGAIGWVIGHEMTHGFDDQGRQYDKDGNLKDWWTAEDAANFNNRTSLLVTEYNTFEVLPGLYSNGNLTLGENIADFGGLTLSYHAWKETGNQTTGIAASNHTADREFFFSAAQTWRENARDDARRTWVYTDPHSDNKYRVDGVVFNIPEFYDAFPEVTPGDALYRNASERPVIW
ncbi:M13 family metallopeptidase [Methanoregula sp. UBA64]|uniref:M13 family metallopeptidase n=1 Tax=Methanoregula sp. UBA64 TaxID=1915554 RepID=UPI0025F917FC|nr:M13 family metallopeptidase [Methanoregula sp. UBA64]